MINGIVFLILSQARTHVLLERCPRKREVLGVGEWFVPGGKIEPGETPEDALGREVGEELGLLLYKFTPLPLIEGSPIPPTSKGVFIMRPYLIKVFGNVPKQTIDTATPLRWVPIMEALQSPVPQVRAMVAMAMGASA